MHYSSFRFLPRPLDITAGSQICPYLARNTLELVGALQLGPPGGRGGPAEIPASSPVLAAGKGRGDARGVPRARFAPDLGAGAASARRLDGTGQRPALRARLW
jgi:hypothetical protein